MQRLRDLADEQPGASLDPLGAQHKWRHADGDFGQDRADMLRRHDDQQRVAIGQLS